MLWLRALNAECSRFLLPDEHPMLRRSYRSQHCGGSIETEVLQLLRLKGVDRRLTATWHWIVPLFVIWLVILAMVFVVVPATARITPPIVATFRLNPIEAYCQISQLFAYLMMVLVVLAMPLNHIVGATITRHNRQDFELRELSLTSLSAREYVGGLWMRMMTGYRVFEIIATLNVVNFLLAVTLWYLSGTMTSPSSALAHMPAIFHRDPHLFLILGQAAEILALYTFGMLGARRGALDGIISGFADLQGWPLFWRAIRLSLWHALFIGPIALFGAIFAPLTLAIIIMLAIVDIPLLYLLSGGRDFQRFTRAFTPAALEEGLSVEQWSRTGEIRA